MTKKDDIRRYTVAEIHMRFDADVLEFYRSGGRGWQGRMNAVLRSFMEKQS